jgi:hypothetical protein
MIAGAMSVRDHVPAIYAMWRGLVYPLAPDDYVIETVRTAHAQQRSELSEVLSLIPPALGSVTWGPRIEDPPKPQPSEGPVAALEWILATMNAEALRSIAALYFGHGVCCHTLAALWKQDPRTIIGRLERGYGLAEMLPRDGKPWRIRTGAELDALAASLDLARHYHRGDQATRFQLSRSRRVFIQCPRRCGRRLMTC